MQNIYCRVIWVEKKENSGGGDVFVSVYPKKDLPIHHWLNL